MAEPSLQPGYADGYAAGAVHAFETVAQSIDKAIGDVREARGKDRPEVEAAIAVLAVIARECEAGAVKVKGMRDGQTSQ